MTSARTRSDWISWNRFKTSPRPSRISRFNHETSEALKGNAKRPTSLTRLFRFHAVVNNVLFTSVWFSERFIETVKYNSFSSRGAVLARPRREITGTLPPAKSDWKGRVNDDGENNYGHNARRREVAFIIHELVWCLRGRRGFRFARIDKIECGTASKIARLLRLGEEKNGNENKIWSARR